jgi:uncharacterized protein YjdB
MGVSDTFTSGTGGGVWNSGSTSIATIDSFSGITTGITSGGVNISYTLANGCRSTRYLSVLALPGSITGATTVCIGNVVSLLSSTSGGTWSSSDPSVANTGTTGTGSVTSVSGVTTGTALISYVSSLGCYRTTTISVSPAIAEISGDSVVCVGQAITLTNTSVGGTWTSSTPSKATVGIATGITTGIATGTSSIRYSTGTGCYRSKIVTVNASIPTITGPSALCVSDTGVLANTLAGGNWFSTNPGIASVDSASGTVSGISSGSVTISYRVTSGCFRTTGFIVKNTPATIAGPSEVFVGATTTLTNTTSGGTWSSGTPSVASISSGGVVTGASAGSTVITYRIPTTGCQSTKAVTVLSGAGKIEAYSEKALRLYPNPARSSFVVELPTDGVMYMIAITGETIQNVQLLKGENSVAINENVANGVYLCRIVLSDGTSDDIKVIISR